MHSFSYFNVLSLFFMVIPFILGYLVIRLAVRHAIDSSDVGQLLLKHYQKSGEKDNDKK